MRLSVNFLLVLACLLILSMPIRADFSYEINLKGGYTGNLLNDSLGMEDSYSTSRASFKYYPLSTLEIGLSSEYTYYSKTYGLSNLLYSGTVIHIPTVESSPVTVYLSAGYDRVRYRENIESFDNKTIRVKASLSYRVSSGMRLRTGSNLAATRYVNADSISADNDQYELFAGANMSFLGSNSLDIETGFSFTNYSFINDSLEWFNPVDPGLRDGHFRSFYISPRFSRPLGLKTGISVTYKYRHFANINRAVVLGYATGFLSPWALVFDGSSIVLQLKSYLVPHVVVSAGAGYWDKTYLKTLERVYNPSFHGFEWPPPNQVPRRKDYFTRLYLSFQRPITFGFNGVLEPTVTVDYSHNNSSLATYDYSSTTVTVGLTYRR